MKISMNAVQNPEQNPPLAFLRASHSSTRRQTSTRAWIVGLLVCGLLLVASSSQALSVDLSSIGSGTTDLDVDGFSLTVQSQNSRFLPLEQLSITFNDGPVSLNSVDVLFPESGGIVLADLMGEVSMIGASEAGLVSIDGGGIQGTRVATLSFGRGIQIQRIDFDIVSVGGVDVRPRPTPTSPIPEPGAALLFSTGLGLVAFRQRASARSSAIPAAGR